MARTKRDLRGKVAAVTGGGRGIGRETARALAAAGMTVAVGDLDREAAEAVAEEIGGTGLELDVTDEASFESFLEAAESEHGQLDVLVNNAGILHLGPFVEETLDQTRRQIEVNVIGVVIGTRAALRRMVPRRSGHIVNVASSAGRLATPPGEATYAATKHAVVGLTETVRREHLGGGIDFSIVMPGVVKTEMAAGYVKSSRVKEIGPEEVAAGILRALHTGQVDVWVPRELGPLHRISTLLPRRGRDLMIRALGADEITWNADRSARTAYDARVER